MARENKEAVKNTHSRIVAKKRELSRDFAKYNKSLRPLKKAIRAYESAEAAYSAKDSAKNERRLREAGFAIDGHLIKSSRVYSALMNTYREILAEYDYLDSVSSPRSQLKAEKMRAKFSASFLVLVDRANAGLSDFVPRESSSVKSVASSSATIPTKSTAPVLDYPPDSEKAEPSAAPSATLSSNVSVSSVGVAPVTIDITPMVEKAVSATVDKLSRDLDKKLSAFVEGLKIPTEQISVVSAHAAGDLDAKNTYSGANTELEAHILEEEQHIFEKLKSLLENIQITVEGLSELTALSMTNAAKQKEIAELQRQVNDAQRFTLREQQGIQVNQKVISEDQTDLAGKQAMAQEAQKNALEAQSAVDEAFKSVLDTQLAVSESQKALEAAMMEVVNSQKELLTAQQEIIKASDKQRDLQMGVREKQSEIYEAEKAFLADQRQLLKDHKAIKERQKAIAEELKELAPQQRRRTRTTSKAEASDNKETADAKETEATEK